MKHIKYMLIISIIFVFFLPYSVLGNQYTEIASYKQNELNIISYSKSWDKQKLKDLYEELMKNVTSSELVFLKNIYIYPDSPLGVNGHYFEDIDIIDGYYVYQKNSYINLYNADKYNTIRLIAPILSHEYGHHYTMFHLLNKENVYYNNIELSEYAKIRKIQQFPIYYIGSVGEYEYHWDLLEILADDYVQLLGSPNAKLSKDYKSSDELINLKDFDNDDIYFNLKPSINPYIPLATNVDGLYSYFLSLGGYTHNTPHLKKYPILSKVVVSKTDKNEFSYKIRWSEAVGNGPFEYTLIMYPVSNPFSPIGLKTVKTGEPLEAIFGSYSEKTKNNKVSYISKKYEGEFVIKLFIKDAFNFIYETKPINFNFTNSYKFVKKEDISHIKEEKNNDNYDNSNNIIIGPKLPNSNNLSNILFNSNEK